MFLVSYIFNGGLFIFNINADKNHSNAYIHSTTILFDYKKLLEQERKIIICYNNKIMAEFAVEYTSSPVCAVCLRHIALTQAGMVRLHGPFRVRCPGSGRPPGSRPVQSGPAVSTASTVTAAA